MYYHINFSLGWKQKTVNFIFPLENNILAVAIDFQFNRFRSVKHDKCLLLQLGDEEKQYFALVFSY